MYYKTVRRFLEPDGGQGGNQEVKGPKGDIGPKGPKGDPGPSGLEDLRIATPQIDYGKIQQMLDGTLAAKEDTALKAYFKQQGLSQQEVEQAIESFKEQKAANQPNVEALQQQATAAMAEARQAQIQQAATMAAVGLGISVTSIPYVLKMADFSQTVGQDGKISNEKLTEALNKVLEDVPALKPQDAGNTGFLQVGAGGDPSQHAQQATVQQPQTPAKRWNRWN